jgi:hypothetical protein
MTSFDDRQNAFENKFALDETLLFKAEARACKNLGLWLAEKMELSEAEANTYAASIVGANLEEPGFDDVKRHVIPDITKYNLNVSDSELDAKLAELYEQAQKEIKEEAA